MSLPQHVYEYSMTLMIANNGWRALDIISLLFATQGLIPSNDPLRWDQYQRFMAINGCEFPSWNLAWKPTRNQSTSSLPRIKEAVLD